MVDVFLKIVNMSISASWLVLAVLVFRLVFKKAPKWIHVLLWGIVAVRLLCPFSIESALSLIPSAETISPEIMMSREPTIHTGVPAINSVVNPIITETFAPEPVASANPLQILIPVLAMIWGIGVALLLAYTAISYWRLRRRVRMAVLLRDNIYQSEAVSSPFVLGIIKPKIYLPFQIDGQNLEHVVSHEQAHIRRRDHWWKPLGFLLLTIHWFNPIMWLAYVLLCRDIELACDEKVVKELGMEQRADYSHALLACSVNRRMIAACPLAFGEVGVKERVKTVLNYKKPAFWVIVVSLIACAVVAVCFLTNPIDAIEGYYHVEGYGIYNDSEYYVVVNDGVELKCTKEQYEQVASLMERFRTGEMQDTPIRVKYKQFLISYKRGTVIELEIPENESFGKTYVYENEGIMGSFTITLYNDGTFTYYEGMASSYLGFGSWKQEGDIITMTDDGHGGLGLVNRFKLDGDDLIFVEDGSFNFIYVKVQDGERFHCTGEAFKPADAITQHGNNETLSLGDIVTLSKKGYDLTWSDFDQYKYIETGSGLYIRIYEIDEQFGLMIGGAPDRTPMYIYLCVSGSDDVRIDIRDGGVVEFISENAIIQKLDVDALEDLLKAFKESLRDEGTVIATDCVIATDGAYGLDGVVQYTDESGVPWKLAFIRDGIAYPVGLAYTEEHFVANGLTYLGNGAVQVHIENSNSGKIEVCTMEYIYDEEENHTKFRATTEDYDPQEGNDQESEFDQYYLTIGADDVIRIEFSMSDSSGGFQNVDGSLLKKGEKIWLENLDGYPDLRGLSITAFNRAGEIIWSASIPDGEDNRGFTHLTQDGWTITNIK